jgi:hypothetical protein
LRRSASRGVFGALVVSLACGVDDREVAIEPIIPFPSDTNNQAGAGNGDPEDSATGSGGAAGFTGSGGSEGPPVSTLDPTQPGGAGGAGQGSAGAGTAAAGSAGSGNAGAGTSAGAGGATEPDEPGPDVQVFLLFGQSNMWGVPAPAAQDLEMNARVEVLTLESCGRHGVNQWVVAQPPLHSCVGQPGGGGNGPGLGPGDYFGKTLAAAFPEDTILLVPNAIPGVSIDVFQPGQQAYNSIVSRARLAQQRGEIRGMIFHQGETDSGQASWPTRVRNVVSQLRIDLDLDDVPFVAGELLYGGCCQGHNTLIGQLPGLISNTSIASASGFSAVTNDGFGNLHFDTPAQREFGRRYGNLMIDALTP